MSATVQPSCDNACNKNRATNLATRATSRLR
jgi:hypothetical protein